MELFSLYSKMIFEFLISIYGYTTILVILAIILTLIGKDLFLYLEELEKINNRSNKIKKQKNKK